MIGALVGGLALRAPQPGAAVGLYAVNSLAFVAVLLLYYLAAPGAARERAGLRDWPALHRAAG